LTVVLSAVNFTMVNFTPNTNDHHMPLNETPPWKFSAYATDEV